MQDSWNLLTIKETASCLAVKPCTIRKWIYQGKIPRVKIGRAVRIRQEEIERISKEGLK